MNIKVRHIVLLTGIGVLLIWAVSWVMTVMDDSQFDSQVRLYATVSLPTTHSGVTYSSASRPSTSVPMVSLPTYRGRHYSAGHVAASAATMPTYSATSGSMTLYTTSSSNLNSYGGGSSATGTGSASGATTQSSFVANPSMSIASVAPVATSHARSLTSTADETYARSIRRASSPSPGGGVPGNPGCSDCHWVPDEDGEMYCPDCGCYKSDGCDCDPCRCPIDGHSAFATLPLLLMALIYVFIKKRRTSSCA